MCYCLHCGRELRTDLEKLCWMCLRCQDAQARIAQEQRFHDPKRDGKHLHQHKSEKDGE